MNLKNKVVVITGSTKGIGKEIALEFARNEAKVVVSGRNEDRAKQVCEDIETSGGTAIYVVADVSHPQEASHLMATSIKEFERIDVLVNNAGITKDNLLMRMSEDDWDQVLNINLKGAFHCIKFVTRQMMKQRSGRIINITSVVGQMGNAGQANYAAAKAGIIGLTKSVARELASRNITCNAIAPGFIETDMTSELEAKVRQSLEEQIPLSRLGSVHDVAKVCNFLASDDAAYITGQVINVDGGMVMS
ncbi:3-oxoacyl-[acyl-carrier-protein] reductase [Candidatus Saccharibacteria bacterium]|nr:3-oxoacyl-[acyl-carrier-protein] reductase [Candidatus Saccharibacteria bacterium]NIW78320.1 3-oxoacyl-[acyl-carrier-protein] reductase [Calditrichia bacterium]